MLIDTPFAQCGGWGMLFVPNQHNNLIKIKCVSLY